MQVWRALAHRRVGITWLLGTLAVASLFCIPALLIMTDRPILMYNNNPIPVMQDPIVAGEDIPLLVDRCVYSDSPVVYTFTRTLVSLQEDQPSVLLPNGATMQDPGCSLAESHLHQLPSNIRAGYYYLTGVTITPGHWRTFNIPWYTVPFHVVAKTRE
jgi:hypothetical protein